MTAPDHRPYLLATDLRTAEDVARWLDERARNAPAETVPSFSSFWVLSDAVDALDARLDRERRQACRRASFVALPELARLQRKRKFAVKRLWDYAVQDIDSLRRGHVRQALAFRAVARQP
jgi:hypothetical protein